jgi:hypothetical protein
VNHDEDEPVRMTVEEIGLMREIVRWRRNHDIDRVRVRKLGWDYWVRYGFNGKTREEVWPEFARGTMALTGGPDDPRSVPVASLTQAVDVLVACGFLPARFSSAYRQGWNASAIWHDPEGDEAEFRRLFHDLANISFPVGEHL